MAKDDVEVEGAVARPAKAGLPMPLIGAAVIALLGLGFGGFMFMQMNALKAKLEAGPELQPRGTLPEGHGSVSEAGATAEAEEVLFDLGEFTGNTSDGRYVKMAISLGIESYYNSAEKAAYDHQLEVYDQQLQQFLDIQSGKLGPDGKPAKDNKHALGPASRIVALASGAQLAYASEGAKEAAPVARPEKPARPHTLAEARLSEHMPEIRDLVVEQINGHSGAQLISAEGKREFKQAVIDALNELLDPRSGKVTDLFFSDLVVS